MIGLSLSFCVRDIALGKKNRDDVSVIYAGTRADSQEAWDDVLGRYATIYWKDCPQAVDIAKELIAEGKIVQQRLVDNRAPNVAHGHWVETEDQIVWSR